MPQSNASLYRTGHIASKRNMYCYDMLLTSWLLLQTEWNFVIQGKIVFLSSRYVLISFISLQSVLLPNCELYYCGDFIWLDVIWFTISWLYFKKKIGLRQQDDPRLQSLSVSITHIQGQYQFLKLCGDAYCLLQCEGELLVCVRPPLWLSLLFWFCSWLSFSTPG